MTTSKWVAVFIVLTIVLLFPGTAAAFCVFSSGGQKLICRTCSCAELADAGVNGNCVDVMARANKPPEYDKIIRYSESVVTLHSSTGREGQLASDTSQNKFDKLYDRSNRKERLKAFEAKAGRISAARVEQLARDLNIEIVSGEHQQLVSQAKIALLDRLSAAEICDAEEKLGHREQAANCWRRLSVVPLPFHLEQTQLIDAGGEQMKCWSYSIQGCSIGICAGTYWRCYSSCHGKNCERID